MNALGPYSHLRRPTGRCVLLGDFADVLAFADGPERYWPFIFPAFVLGSAGAMLTYTHTK